MIVFSTIIRFILPVLICVSGFRLYAQTAAMDSLSQMVQAHPQKDTIRVNRLNALGLEARKSTPKDSYSSFTEALEISRSLHYKKGEASALLGLGFYYRFGGEPKPGIDYTLQALPIFQQLKDTLLVLACYYNLSFSYETVGNFEQSLTSTFEGLKIAELAQNQKWIILMNYQLGMLFNSMQDIDKAKVYFEKSLSLAEKTNDKDGMAHAFLGLGWLYEAKENWQTAIFYHEKAKRLNAELNDPKGVLAQDLRIAVILEKQGKYDQVFPIIYQTIQQLIRLEQTGFLPGAHTTLARAHLHTGNPDSALYYGFKALNATQRSGRISGSGDISKVIAEANAKKGKYADAYRYQLMFTRYMDSLNINDAIKRSSARQYSFELEKKQSQISLLTKNEELRKKESRQQKILLFVTLAGLFVLISFSVVLWRINQLKQKAYTRLEHQQEALKATQAQLIQTEKMASLGELTAGIAHEIQNPLNFVNNFSEVNTELIDELEQEIDKGNIGDAKAIAKDIKENEQKINHHGKRADAIVKGMLQHSRSSSGVKEPTNINALADEYLRLAYHGLRAKDKSFNATMKTDFDESIGNINIIPQDIGRAILNLITNAFYVVDEKKKLNPNGYEPTVSISTKKEKDKVEIKVKDNGNGIPQKVLDKIFQPFFTTKPTGQGTGLGLSLSYDIVKAHGGELKVETKEGEFAQFEIILPV
jgi:signal transduction histidine kinase